MNHREVNYDAKKKITVFTSKSRQNEIAAKMRIYEQTNGVLARNNELDVLRFTPQILSAEEWGDAYQVV